MSLIGEQLAGEYEIVEALGHGATSVVYKALRITDSKYFAIKLLHKHLVDKEDTLKRFEQEARAVMLLSHPNIVKVQALNRTSDGQPYLVMDYVEGVSLSFLVRSLKFDLPRASNLFVQIADAMNHAHVHGVIHRSLKPGNIIVSGETKEEEKALVSDFGLAKLLPASGLEIQQLTAKGAVIGSPLYMSPEQCLGRELDAGADIYSMGCLMYACVSGKPPLRGEHIIETMSKHVSEIPLTFDKLCPELKIPNAVQSIIFKCMAKRPEDRYESMEQLKLDLMRYQQGRRPEALSGSASPLEKQLEPEPEPDHDRFLKLVLAVILALLAGLLAYAVWKSPQHKNPDEVELGKASSLKARVVHPISSLALLKQADELSLMNRDLEARALYREAILKAEDREHEQSAVDNEVMATAHYGLAGIYKKMYKWNEAEKEMRLALYVQGLCGAGAAPGKERLQLGLADCLMHQGKLDESQQLLLAFMKETSDLLLQARADLMLADLARVSGKDADAERYELSALEILKGQGGAARREYCLVLARYANHLIGQKQFAKCVNRLKAAINERPASDWDENDLEAAIFLSTELARTLASSGDYKAALDACQSMLDTVKDNSIRMTKRGINSPDTELLIETIAVVRALSGNAEAAEKSLAESLSPEGERLGRIATITRIMIYERQAGEAIAFLSKFKDAAKKQASTQAEYHVLTALALLQQGKSEESLKEVDLAIDTLRKTNDEALHLYCLQIKCKILRQSNRADAAEVIEKKIGRQNAASAAFDYLLPAYQRGGI